MKWTNIEIEILKNNYKDGTEFLITKLKRGRKSIIHKANRLGLFISKETKKKISGINSRKKRGKKENYRVGDITINIDKYSAYVLGLLWTDGYIIKNRNSVGISIIKDDMIDIKWIFEKTGNWYSQERKRENIKTSISLSAYNPNLYDKLIMLDYDKKSKVSPEKIYKLISDENIKYFFRGVIDGDGCFYVNKKNYTYQFSISSTYEQDWEFYINFFKCIGLDFSISRRIQNSRSKSSIIRMCGRKKIEVMINWLYDGYEEDLIGLKRKYYKSLLFLK